MNISKRSVDIEYTESIRKVLKNELNKFVQYMESSIPNNYLYKPIYSRVKTIESMERKEIKRSKMAGKFIHWSEIYDQCGISIIISPIFKTSLIVEKLKQLEKNSSGDFKIMEIENKSDIFGYRAFHIDIEYRSQIRITKVEIQIRSVYEDIYNIISHEYYKENGIQNENNLKKRFHFQSFLLYTSELIQSTTKIKSE
ncbi:hypothetical protein RB653_003910 [Dictyostelium firmibasis]|uniref:RelA/SpoT domain-containing protein n=1 Tax=Dictyostelium firmibasis TaxID=79012 RepID=A0AAN7U5I7_9MYCE